MHDDRQGARQPHRFDPARAAILDDTARFAYVPPETLLAELAPGDGATVVDFGAGTGLYAIALAERRPDVRVVAFDEQPAMLEHLRGAIARAGLPNLEAVDAAGAGALAGRAGGILVLNVLHEAGDEALAEIGALLAPNGAALFVDWNADVERPMGPPRDHVYGEDEARLRLEAAGFRVAVRPRLPYHFVLRGVLPAR
ncbi:MAG TPA: class I SAM-dependent methyltransferase [Candidatus Elarobacter sp.]|jgi:SAM-dependent methyltransferase